jgi:hypothetical protein
MLLARMYGQRTWASGRPEVMESNFWLAVETDLDNGDSPAHRGIAL